MSKTKISFTPAQLEDIMQALYVRDITLVEAFNDADTERMQAAFDRLIKQNRKLIKKVGDAI